MVRNKDIPLTPEEFEYYKKKPLTIPKNYFVCSEQKMKSGGKNYGDFGTDVFDNKLVENRDNEQFFWTSDTVKRIMKATEYMYECCCFTTPSLAHAYHEQGREEKLLDIDERFAYLPRFEKFDIKDPHEPEEGAGAFSVIVIDPPFFVTSLQELFDATNVITGHDYSTKIIIGFLIRYEKTLLEVFKPYGISETSASLEYAHIKPNKWRNFALYSNIDLPGIKRIPGKMNYQCNK